MVVRNRWARETLTTSCVAALPGTATFGPPCCWGSFAGSGRDAPPPPPQRAALPPSWLRRWHPIPCGRRFPSSVAPSRAPPRCPGSRPTAPRRNECNAGGQLPRRAPPTGIAGSQGAGSCPFPCRRLSGQAGPSIQPMCLRRPRAARLPTCYLSTGQEGGSCSSACIQRWRVPPQEPWLAVREAAATCTPLGEGRYIHPIHPARRQPARAQSHPSRQRPTGCWSAWRPASRRSRVAQSGTKPPKPADARDGVRLERRERRRVCEKDDACILGPAHTRAAPRERLWSLPRVGAWVRRWMDQHGCSPARGGGR